MSELTTKALSDDEMREIEARHANRMLIGYLEVAIGDMRGGQETITLVTQDIPALCATVRALRAENELLHADIGEVAQRLMRSADRCGELIIDKESLEAENTALREQLARIRDNATEQFICECEHDNEMCCAVVGEYCPMCIAATALRH